MVAEEIVVSLSGGAPWGFRLQGGAEEHKPLQVSKVRRRSKACRAGLKESDELLAIGHHTCAELSHAQAMTLIDTQNATLNLKVKRVPSGFHSSSAPPCSSMRILSPPTVPLPPLRTYILSPTGIPKGITSPPDSEAYYGETDSDADTQSLSHRRQRRTPPHARSPLRYDRQEEEDASEMSGYESATDAGVSMQGQWDVQGLIGVPRRELIYQPPQSDWTTPEHTPHTLTPHTLTPTPDQGAVEAEGEGDSGFQEAGGCIGVTCPPLVSPERAKEALMLGSSRQLVPMVGPQLTPVSDELSTTYMDKARQARLQRGESQVEKQVKEARTKCRSIASLLTDAPNPNSKGVLMFKKRRQRAKKYTLTCFGKAAEDRGGDTEGETEGETEEEGGSSFQSGSEVDEEGFSASFDPTWDSGYLDLLDRRSAACPPPTPTTPTTKHSAWQDILAYKSPDISTSSKQELELTEKENSPNQGSSVETSITKQPIRNHPAHMSPPAVALTNGGSPAVSRASVVLNLPSQMPPPSQNGHQGDFSPNPDLHLSAGFSPSQGGLNRTARPFAAGPAPSRASVTSVMFRPPQPKPTAMATANQPVAAVSMVTIQPTHHPPGPDAKRAVSSTSLYIPPRNNNSNTPPSANSLPSNLSPPSSLSSTPFSQPVVNPLAFSPAAYAPPSTLQSTLPPAPLTQPSPSPSAPPAAMAIASPPPRPTTTTTADSLATREQRIAVPAARTGILSEARRRSSKKPMFASVQNKDVNPNPDLMSMIQNLDDHVGRTSGAEVGAAPSAEAGHESGPEEDWLRLGAEACNFMQAQRGPRPPPVAPKPQTPQLPQLGGKGGQLFARRQNRMDRYVVERAPSVTAAHYSPTQTREPSPTPSLPATWKYSPNIRAPPPISYNPLLSPSCPPKAQKKPEVAKSGVSGSKKAGLKSVEIMNHQPHQLSSSLFSYGGGGPPGVPSQLHQQRDGPQKTARVYEVKRFSTPPPSAPALKVIVPRSATTLGEPMWRSDVMSPPPGPYQPYQTQWATSPLSPPHPPAPTAPLPQIPTFSSAQAHSHTASHPPANRQFKSAPDLSPLSPTGVSRETSINTQLPRVPRPRFSTSNLGLQPCVWRPGSTLH
ncbi:synaptopodin 2-like protein [Antennarius striatus]|uniref:synaptopodin 2-like protein n=1 Tax=Antennarius striatus TaxID=241820 RepID=UPI0035ADE24D